MDTFMHIVQLLVLGVLINHINLSGQITAFGRITAEIIESVSISSEINKSINVTSSSTIDIGKIKQITNNSVSYNVVITPTTLSNSNGDKLILNTTVKTETATQIKLDGYTTTDNLPHGNYNGTYTVAIAYN